MVLRVPRDAAAGRQRKDAGCAARFATDSACDRAMLTFQFVASALE